MKIRVEQPFCPPVQFEVNWLFPNTPKEQAADIVAKWENITGLCWSLMPMSKVGDLEGSYWVEVSNPISRSHKAVFVWGAGV